MVIRKLHIGRAAGVNEIQMETLQALNKVGISIVTFLFNITRNDLLIYLKM